MFIISRQVCFYLFIFLYICIINNIEKKKENTHHCLLFCSRQLQEGVITQHGVSDGSKVTLLPNVETGLVVRIFILFLT